ncbi:cilium assembly protein DZIP1L-like isoform X3 [Ptychodera flava]|uniref:cilium assembly protein DZIP1L-like isoform X3 n=1 Tax=Ptychodera flava TaxID=63121 RepID=UPI003969FC8B
MKFDNENMDNMMPSGYYNSPRRQAAYAFANQNGYPSIPNGSPRNGPGFSFRKRFERVDWRKMASVDVERVSRDLDFTVLQDNIMNLTFCNIEQELDTRMIDPNYIKLFKLAQLTIEYLLHSQDYLANTISVIEEKLHNAMQEHENTKQVVQKQEEELKNVKKENRKRKKMLEAQQSLIQAGANNYHKCQYCQKAFINASFLQAHMQRRHPEFALPQATLDLQNQASRANERLEKEIDDLRDRLKHAESEIDRERRTHQEQLSARELSELQRREEEHKKEMERWKQEQLEEQRREMDNRSEMFMKELKEMHEKYAKSQQELEDLQNKFGKKSNLGTLMDDEDIAEQKALMKKQKEELDRMKREIKKQNDSMSKEMQEQLRQQEKRWKDKMKELNNKHRNELEMLGEDLEHTKMSLKVARSRDQDGQRYENQIDELMKQSKDQKKVIKLQEKQLKELAGRVAKPPPSPPIVTTHEPSSDEEKPPLEGDLDDTSEQIQDESILSSESEDDQDDRMARTDTKLDPNVIASLKEEFKELLEKNLEKRGVARGSQGISNQSFNNKIAVLKKERQQLAKKYPQFYDTRDECRNEVEAKAKEKARGMKRSPGISRTASAPAASPVEVKARSANIVTVGGSRSKSLGRSPRKKKTDGRRGESPIYTPPPVAPRSPDKIGTMSTLSTGSWDTTTFTRAESEEETETETETEEEEEETEEEEEEEEEEDVSENWDSDEEESELKRLVSSTEVDSAKPTVAPAMHRKGQDTESITDLKPISEVDDLQSTNEDNNDKVKEVPKTGSSVKERARDIERQLSWRGGQKPTGGIDVGGSLTQPGDRLGDQSQGSPTPRIPTMMDADEDSDFSISSIDEMSSAASKPVAASNMQPSPAARQRTVSETDSSNTYGTSMWGSSHKGPAPSKEAGRGTPGTQGTVSVTDWDDDDDLDLDEITT